MSTQIHKITSSKLQDSLESICMNMGTKYTYAKRFSIGEKPSGKDYQILSSYMRILKCECLLTEEESKKLKEKTNKLILKYS